MPTTGVFWLCGTPASGDIPSSTSSLTGVSRTGGEVAWTGLVGTSHSSLPFLGANGAATRLAAGMPP